MPGSSETSLSFAKKNSVTTRDSQIASALISLEAARVYTGYEAVPNGLDIAPVLFPDVGKWDCST